MSKRIELENRLGALMADAQDAGFNITVYLRPIPGAPLAMGAVTMEGSVRPTKALRDVCPHNRLGWINGPTSRCLECDAEVPL